MSELATHPDGERDGLARYTATFRRRWRLIAAIVVVVVGLTAGYALTAAKRYDAEADILVTPIPSDSASFLGINTLLRASTQSDPVVTAARIAQSPAVVADARRRLGRHPDVSVAPVSQSDLVAVHATADTARGAAAIANGYAASVLAVQRESLRREVEAAIRHLRNRLGEIAPAPARSAAEQEAVAIRQRLAELVPLLGQPDPTLSIVSRAVPPASASWPRPALSIGVGFLVALLAGLGLALALDLVSPHVKDADELLLEHRLPILGAVPRVRRRELERFVSGHTDLPPHLREAYRIIRGTLEQAGADGGYPRSIVVTSAGASEGKTITAISLANAIVRSGLSVVLVDGDLRKPMLSAVFGVPSGRGLGALLRGSISVDAALRAAPGRSAAFQLLLSAPDPGVVDLLDKRRVGEVLAELESRADVVVIDSSALTEVADAFAFAAAVDLVVLCVRLGKTRRDRLTELRRRLAQLATAPAGFVVVGGRKSRRPTYARRTGDDAVAAKLAANGSAGAAAVDLVHRR